MGKARRSTILVYAVVLILCLPIFNLPLPVQTWEGHSEGVIEVVSPVAILSHHVSLEDSDRVHSSLNVTTEMVSSVTVSCQFLLIDPSGTIIYDNFRGIGGSIDFKLTPVYNNSISTIDFLFSLPTSTSGTYSYMISLFGADYETLYSTTGWLPAFIYIPPTTLSYDLGSLSSESSIISSLNASINRFESIKCTFALLSPVTSIVIILASSPNSKFIGRLNQSNIVNTEELHFLPGFPWPMWLVYNLPLGQYDLTLAAMSDVAFLGSISINSGPEIISPAIFITKVESTSETATPEGTMSYHIFTEWNISASDTLSVSAEFQGGVVEESHCEVLPLHNYGRDFYLTVEAPIDIGDYEVEFQATLEQAGVSDHHVADLFVRSGQYNITVVSKVQYWKVHTLWNYLLTGKKIEYFDDPNQLSALDVTRINVTCVDEWYDNGKPKSVTIAFSATNKLTGEIAENLNFGEGVHYEVGIMAGSSERFLLTILLAGDSEIVYAPEIPVDENGILTFQIVYSQWILGGLLELGSSVLQTALSVAQLVATGGLTEVLVSHLVDIAKLTLLYLGKIVIQEERGYMTKETVLNFLDELRIARTEAVIDLLDEALEKTRNPCFALLAIIHNLHERGEVDLWTVVYAICKLTIFLTAKTAIRLPKLLFKALKKALAKFGVKLTSAKVKTEKLLDLLGAIFSIGETIMTIWRYFTSPSEEGKIVSEAQIDTKTGITVDPVITVAFNGSPLSTNITYFGDVYCVKVDVTDKEGYVTFVVDSDLTSTYLLTFSDPIFRRNLLSGFGFNATQTSLDWEEASNTFIIQGNGSMYSGLHRMKFNLNNTYIEGLQEMSLDAIQVGDTALLNLSLTYPFGKKLNYTIRLALPLGSRNIDVLSNGNYTVENYVITWDMPVDQIEVQFNPDETPPSIGTPFRTPDDIVIDPEQEVIICVNVTDVDSGVYEVILSWWSNRTLSWDNVTMYYNVTSGLYEGTIPGQIAQTHVKYIFIARDNVGNVAINDDAEQYYVGDRIPPEIIHITVTSGYEGQEIAIIATITDNVEVVQATLYYRRTRETTYTSVSMTKSESTYTGTIPASAVTLAGVRYYINATDGVNFATHPATDPMTSPHIISVHTRVSIPWEWLAVASVVAIVLVAAALIIKRRKS